MKHIPHMTIDMLIRKKILGLSESISFDGDYFDGLVDEIHEWYKANNTQPKPYSDPSMGQVLNELFGGEWFHSERFAVWTDWPYDDFDGRYNRMIDAQTANVSGNWVESARGHVLYCIAVAKLAARGYYPDIMFEDGKFKY